MQSVHADGSCTITLTEKERKTLATLLDRANPSDPALDHGTVITLWRYLRTEP